MKLSPWELPVDVVPKIFQDIVKVAQKPENAAKPIIGPMFHSSAWRASLTMRVARLVDRGPTARSTCAELHGDRVRGYSERMLSSTEVHSTFTSGVRVGGCLSRCR